MWNARQPLENWESITVDTSVVVPVDLFRLTPLQSFLERLFFERSFNSEPPILRQSGEAKVDQSWSDSATRSSMHCGNTLIRPKKFAPLFAVEILGNAIWPDDGELPAGTMISSDDRRAFDALGVDPLGSRVPCGPDVESQTDRLRLGKRMELLELQLCGFTAGHCAGTRSLFRSTTASRKERTNWVPGGPSSTSLCAHGRELGSLNPARGCGTAAIGSGCRRMNSAQLHDCCGWNECSIADLSKSTVGDSQSLKIATRLARTIGNRSSLSFVVQLIWSTPKHSTWGMTAMRWLRR